MIADLHDRGQRAELQQLVRVAARLIFAATLAFTLVVVALGREILDLFGPEFRAGYIALLILCAGSLVNALAGPVGSLMTMTGQQSTAAVILAVNAAANLVLSAILIPRYGVEGAAVATAVTTAGWNLGMAVAAWKRLGLRATIW
jgi:O-antigen/teichoic acid export membrane protein